MPATRSISESKAMTQRNKELLDWLLQQTEEMKGAGRPEDFEAYDAELEEARELVNELKEAEWFYGPVERKIF